MYNLKPVSAVFSEGMPHTIANLTNKELIEYYHKYYDANNISVLLTGAFSDDLEDKYLQTIPADIVQSHYCGSSEPMDCSSPEDNHLQHDTIKFPSSYTSTGSIIFGWYGPENEDAETNIALEILIEYLIDGPSGPLNMRFVQNSTPLADSTELNIFFNVSSVFSIIFNNVPYLKHRFSYFSKYSSMSEENGDTSNKGSNSCKEDSDIPHLFEKHYLEKLLLDELKRIHDTQFDGNLHALENAVKHYRDRFTTCVEESPHNVLRSMICPDIVASHFTPGSQGKLHIRSHIEKFNIIAELAEKPIAYWLGLLKKWLIDGTVYSVTMVPNQVLELKLEAERSKSEANKGKIIDKDAHASYIKKIVEASMAPVPEEIKINMPTPDPFKTAIVPHTQSLEVLDKAIGPVSAVQSINADSGFVEIHIHMPIGNIPDDQRTYLTLFQNIFLGEDIVLPAGVIYDTDEKPLQSEKYIRNFEYNNRMSELEASKYSAVGRLPETTEYGLLGNMFVINYRMPHKNYAHVMRWIVQIIMFTEFTTDKILIYTQNILDKINDKKRDIDDVSLAMEVHFTEVPNAGELVSNRHHMGLLVQEVVLKGIMEELRVGKADKIIKKLKDIQSMLIHATGGFMALLLPFNENSGPYIEMFRNEWQMCYEKYAECNGVTVKSTKVAVKESPFPIPYITQFLELTNPLLIHVPVKSLCESKIIFSFKLDTPFYPAGTCSIDEQISNLASLDYFALKMLLVLLGRTDGPLNKVVLKERHFYRMILSIEKLSKTLIMEIEQPYDILGDMSSYA